MTSLLLVLTPLCREFVKEQRYDDFMWDSAIAHTMKVWVIV